MPTSPVAVVGIAWYRPDKYEQVVALMADGASFPKTYASWRQKAVRMERELNRQGSRPVRVELDPGVFADWCRDRQMLTDSGARARFVADAVAGGGSGVPG